MPTFIRIGASPAKAAINSERAIAESLTDAWLPCQKSSALQWPAQSNYRLKAEDFLKLQNPSKSIWFAPSTNVRFTPKSGHGSARL